jgi:glutathione S-transferase
LLEELNLDYDIKVHLRQKDKHSPPELKQVHPLGKSPVITIQAPRLEKPLVLAESAAIVEYLSDHFGQQLTPKRYPDGEDGLIGAETKEWLRYRVSVIRFTESLLPLIISEPTCRPREDQNSTQLCITLRRKSGERDEG